VLTFGHTFGVVFELVMILFGALSWGEWDAIALTVAGLAFAAFVFVRVGGAGVFVEDDGVRVRSLFRTLRLAWSEIASFVFVPYGACCIKLTRPGRRRWRSPRSSSAPSRRRCARRARRSSS
jgi:hypothetical protein